MNIVLFPGIKSWILERKRINGCIVSGFQKCFTESLIKTGKTSPKRISRTDDDHFHNPSLFSTRYAFRFGPLREISSATNPVTNNWVPITMASSATKNKGRWVRPVLSKKNFDTVR